MQTCSVWIGAVPVLNEDRSLAHLFDRAVVPQRAQPTLSPESVMDGRSSGENADLSQTKKHPENKFSALKSPIGTGDER